MPATLDAGPIALADLAHLPQQQQRRAENRIAALIELLDALDGNAELEDGGDTEPNCGVIGADDTCEGNNVTMSPA